MSWIWQQPGWPDFTWNQAELAPLEARFRDDAGRRIGAWRRLGEHERIELRVGWLSDEAAETSAIEGEPPSDRMATEMDGFIAWYERACAGEDRLSPLTCAGAAHLYFVFIHPFEDGNGRNGRALAEKALARALGHPSLIALARTTIAASPARRPPLLRVIWPIWWPRARCDVPVLAATLAIGSTCPRSASSAGGAASQRHGRRTAP